MKMKLALLIVMAFCLSSHIEGALQVGYYRNRCPSAEGIIKHEVTRSFLRNKGIAPGILRMHFHDCFVRGCDGSVLIDSTPKNQAEKEGIPNKGSLRGVEVIDRAKARIEAACKGVVSCADIIAYAARESISLTGGLHWDVPAGRRDGRISRASETLDIPGPPFNLSQLTQFFAKKGLTQGEMVALSGVHSIGHSHCTSFNNRLYNFNATTNQDPSLNPYYAQFLKKQCPPDTQAMNVSQSPVVFMNESPSLLDSSYYRDLFNHRGLFTSDESLLDSKETARKAVIYGANDLAWQKDFVKAMIKMSKIQVLTGKKGEIRANCRVINP